MSSRKIQNRKPLPVYALVGDGYSEKIYFDELKTIEQLRNVQIKPDLPSRSGKGGSFMRVMQKAKELYTEGYDKVFCLIDFDAVIHENKTEEYKTEKGKLEKKGVIVLECNPCFEFWYLLHLQKTAKSFMNCESVVAHIKNTTELKDYSKEQSYQKLIYQKLRSKMPDAIENASVLEQNRSLMGLNYPRAEVFKAIKELLSKNKR